MLDMQSAKEKASLKLGELCPAGDRWLILDDKTIERPFGWIFFYNSEEFLKTGSVMYRLAGNGPVFVNRKTGSVDMFGSTPTLEVIMAEYERKLTQG